MSQDSLEQFLGRLITDDEFRMAAVKSIGGACATYGFVLTENERRVLRTLNFDDLVSLADALCRDIKRCGKTYKRAGHKDKI